MNCEATPATLFCRWLYARRDSRACPGGCESADGADVGAGADTPDSDSAGSGFDGSGVEANRSVPTKGRDWWRPVASAFDQLPPVGLSSSAGTEEMQPKMAIKVEDWPRIADRWDIRLVSLDSQDRFLTIYRSREPKGAATCLFEKIRLSGESCKKVLEISRPRDLLSRLARHSTLPDPLRHWKKKKSAVGGPCCPVGVLVPMLAPL
ncbi:hypothetical protein V8F20_005032 [Naviculisporaceae sp. PSN 640]